MKRNIIIGVACIIVAFGAIIGLAKACAPQTDPTPASSVATQSKNKKTHHKKAKKINAAIYRPYKDPKDLRKAGTWKKKSETKKHPKINPNETDLTLRVSLKGNRTYLLRKGKVIYTMLSTGGIYKKGKSLTPTGKYTIQGGRGDSFFNYNLGEGANNWTSWSPDNVYLFHSVPTKGDGTYNLKEAKKLGQTQGSHGCIRLSVPDSRWIMNNIPNGTKVVIKDKQKIAAQIKSSVFLLIRLIS